MSEYDFSHLFASDDDDENDGPPNGTQQLPKQLRDVIKALNKKLDETTAENKSLREERRSLTVAEALKARNVPEKVAKLVPPDADVDQWLTEYGDLFDVKEGAGDAPVNVTIPPSSQLDQNALALQRMQQTASGASTFSADPAALLAKIQDPNLSDDEFLKMLNASQGQ